MPGPRLIPDESEVLRAEALCWLDTTRRCCTCSKRRRAQGRNTGVYFPLAGWRKEAGLSRADARRAGCVQPSFACASFSLDLRVPSVCSSCDKSPERERERQARLSTFTVSADITSSPSQWPKQILWPGLDINRMGEKYSVQSANCLP